jgi:hypothetical protein
VTIIDVITGALTEGRTGESDGLRFRGWPSSDVINVGACGRDLTRTDVDAVRAALTEAGYSEVKSWIAAEGMSWLSDGVRTVSFKVEAAK